MYYNTSTLSQEENQSRSAKAGDLIAFIVYRGRQGISGNLTSKAAGGERPAGSNLDSRRLGA